MDTTTTPTRGLAGKNLDPEFKHARAKKATAARHTPRTYAASIVRRWPALTGEQRAEIRQILAPVLAEGAR